MLLAVIAIAALGIVSLTLLELARMERRAGLGAIARVQARAAAEAALAQALLGWPATSTPAAVGGESVLASLTVPGPASAEARIRSLGGQVYAIISVGVRSALSGELLAEARLEQLVLLDPPDSLGTTRPRRYPRGWRSLP